MKNTLARLNTARSRRMTTEDIATADRLRAAGEAAVAAATAPPVLPAPAPMIAAPVVLSETYEVSEAEFIEFRRDALHAGFKVTTSVFLSAGYQVTISRTLPTELDALEASHTDGDFTHGRIR